MPKVVQHFIRWMSCNQLCNIHRAS